MQNFWSSPSFAVIAAVVGLAIFAFVALWKNIHWTERGITPADMVTSLKSGFTGGKAVLKILAILLVVGLLAWLIVSFGPGAVEWFSGIARSPGNALKLLMSLWPLYLLVAIVLMIMCLFRPKLVTAASAFAIAAVIGMIGAWWQEGSKTETAAPRAMREVRDPGDCTYARPCTPAQYTDGSTERVAVPENKRVCFDPPIWSDLEGVGFIVASKGQKEHRYACSVDEVAQGRCTEAPIVTFRFVPKPGVIPPRHWFTDKPDLIC